MGPGGSSAVHMLFRHRTRVWTRYASITMSTSLASLVGVHDVVDTAQIASNTVARSDFTVLVYFSLLAMFFLYCWPIALATRALERHHDRR